MTDSAEPLMELEELQAQRKSAKESYHEQKKVLRTQIKELKQGAKRTRKISRLESRLEQLKKAATPE
ncbi:MAG: hypothetical protein H7837_07300 [Magnetococcus sp. MYC-9]